MITDLNGAVTYSKAIALSFGNGPAIVKSNISIYPNPTNAVVNLAIQNSNASAGSSSLSLGPPVTPLAIVTRLMISRSSTSPVQVIRVRETSAKC